MKQCKLFMAALLAALCLLTCAAADEPVEYQSGDYQYILLEDGTAEITDYTGTAETLTVPDTLDGYRVTSIGDDAFAYCRSLTNITLPDGVTSIGDDAFAYCRSLTNITLPDGVTSIGDDAFFYCDSLTSITLPDSVTQIGANPFQSCEKLTAIRVSPNHPVLATIDGVLFDKTEKKLICYPCAFTASSYAVPNGILSIGDYAFYSCESLTSITLLDSVTSIGDCAFYSCYSLTSITLPDSVTSIGDCAFYSCSSLTSITLPDGLTSIGDMAFLRCSSLTSITLPDSLTSIGYKAFSSCPEQLTFTVPMDSWAEQWCRDNNMNYTFPNANDWLLN